MNALGAASYGSAAVLFLVLVVLLVTSWQGRGAGVRLILGVAMTVIWAAGLAWQAWDESLPLVAVYTLEILRGGAWLMVLAGLTYGVLPRFLTAGSYALWIGLLVAGWVLAVLQSRVVLDLGPGALFAPGGLAIALAGLVLLEQIYRNANASGRYAFKFLAIGLGGVFAYDLFLFSQAELLKGISEDLWVARGFVNALLLPFIAIAARRNPNWSLDVFVSRQVVVFSTAVVAVGIYLLAMAAGGYLIREIGGRWGDTANIIFLAGALVVLAVIILSGTVRRRLTIFVSKHFYRNKYDYRIEWLRFVETLSATDGEDVRRKSLHALAQIFESPGAVLYAPSEPGKPFVPAAAWPMRLEDLPDLAPVPAGHEMLRFLGERQGVIDLQEHARTPEVYQNLEVPAAIRSVARIRMVTPLLQPTGLAGFVLLYEPPAPFELTFEDRDLLTTLGRHVATIVAQYDTDRRLAESRQFEGYHRLTAFMMHDLKNSVAQLQLVVRNADKHRDNPEFIDDAIGTIDNAVGRMTRLIEQLRDASRRQVEANVDLAALVQATVGRCADRQPAPALAQLPSVPIQVKADAERLSAALEHVIRNAQDATDPGGTIEVHLDCGRGKAVIGVRDTGSGMSPEFVRERLFRPFDSTKGSKGMGIGAYQTREYVRSLGGDVEVQSGAGSGTLFALRLPVLDTGP